MNEEYEQQISKKERREMHRDDRRQEEARTQKSRSFRRIALWGLSFIILTGSAVGVYYAAVSSAPPANNNGNTVVTDAISSSDWVRGNPDAAVTLIEYGDFQCPACAQYHPIVKGLKSEFGETVRFVFRHFPLYRVHPNAELAAKSAEAAGRQGKFWEMHDMLFERQQEWSPKPRPHSTFVGYAEELGLNIEQFEADINRNDVEDKISADVQSGFTSAVNSTPTFFLNGEKISNPVSFDDFRHTLAGAVAAASPVTNQMPAEDSGVPEMIVTPETTDETGPDERDL